LINIPVAVDPALMLMNGDLSGLAKLALHNLDTLVLAIRGLATGAVVGAEFCKSVSDEIILLLFDMREEIPRR
jgi:hypothetical protein